VISKYTANLNKKESIMKPNRICIGIAAAFMLLTAGTTMADELWLKNGDHITGKVVRMENKTLIFKTSYAGEVSIKWGEIANIRTDEPIQMVLSNEVSTQGIATPAENGKVKVKVDQIEEPVTFELAQVEIINPKPPEPALKISARANVGLTGDRGNTETDNLYLDGEFVARTEKNRFSVGAEMKREEANGERTANSALGYLKYDHFLSKKWYFYANALFETDEFQDLNLRSTVGAGAGHQFFETPLTNLSLELGLSYVDEDYDEADDDNYSAGRWALKYDRFFFDKFLQFFHFQEGYVSLEDTSDILFRSRTGFRIPVYKSFNVTAQYNFDWNSDPAPDREEVDTRYIFSLGYQY
jgi:putative salt-induced outer membrane protein YdiY